MDRLGGRSLDDNQPKEAAEGRYPDFGCFRDLLLIEMKHLATDQSERVNDTVLAKINPAEMPVFFGLRESRHITNAVSNGAAVSRAVASKLGRTLEEALSSANKQFFSYRKRHPRKNTANLCVILNAKLRDFTPDLVARSIHGKMKADQTEAPRFPAIDAILYISEKHFCPLPDGRPALALVIYLGMGATNNPWKEEVVDRIVSAWTRLRTGGPAVNESDTSGFDIVHDIPETMKRHEFWSLEYARNPYLSMCSTEELRFLFHRAMALNARNLLEGNWPRPTREIMTEDFRRFQHLIAETNRRGIDMRQLDRRFLSEADIAGIYRDLPVELIDVLRRTQ